ncbi:hypothetical protein DN748_09650 [Sinomicrobium soli]|nr:hypothetical protein [Sinomicrobium oceani]RAV29174.1 hypothetical protein DN748_09650 [Sinomicrobium sp. N-1-3-6]
MNLGATLIGIICVLICAVPFIWTSNIRRKKEKGLLLALQNSAKQQHCEITQHEVCGNYAIGMDEKNNHVFFQLKTGEDIETKCIDLSVMEQCEVENISKYLQKNKLVIEGLNLHFTATDVKQTAVVLEFYNHEVSYPLIGELQSIEKWNTLINKQIQKIKQR